MVKLILSLTLIWMLSSAAGALQCQGTNGTCSANQYCAAGAENSSLGTHQWKSCMPSSVCDLSRDQTFSFNFGFFASTVSLKCCNTDNCNNETVPVPGAQTEKDLQCYACDNDDCNKTVKCVGVEDRCIKGKVANGTNITEVLGCASKNLCEPNSMVYYLSEHLNFTTEQKCCETNLCNSAWTIKPSVLPFLLGLILLVAS